MQAERRLSLIVGTFVVLCLAAGAAVILSLSAQGGFFAPRYALIAHFENVLGLQANAPVWLDGKEVGRVESGAVEQRRRQQQRGGEQLLADAHLVSSRASGSPCSR